MIRFAFILLILSALPPVALAQGPGDTHKVSMDDVLAPASLRDRPTAPVRQRGARSDDRPVVIDGLSVRSLYSGLGRPVAVAQGTGGDVFVADALLGLVYRLRDRNQDGEIDSKSTFLVGLDGPSDMLISGDQLFISDKAGVWQLTVTKAMVAETAAAQIIDFTHLTGLADGPFPLALVDNGATLLVGLPAPLDRRSSPDYAGSVAAYDLTQQRTQILATGVRAAASLTPSPSGEVWMAVEEAGDQARDYVARLTPDAFYGFPFGYGTQIPAGDFGRQQAYKVAAMQAPDLLLERGGGPTALVFIPNGALLPAWGGDGLLALSGSDVDGRGGFHIVRTSFKHGAPSPTYETVITGFRDPDGRTAWGRPADMLILEDGRLLIADNWSGQLWAVDVETAPETPSGLR